MNSDFRIRLDNHRFQRINILESAKKIAEQLRDYDSLRGVKFEKKKKLEHLDRIMLELRSAMEEFNLKEVPHMNVYPKGSKPIEVLQMQDEMVKPQLSRKESQLARELDEIETKLRSL